MPKEKQAEDTIESLSKQVKELSAKVNALESEKGKKQKKSPSVARKPSEYNIYFKKCMEDLKKEFPDMSHQDRFKEVGKRWKESKESKEY